MSAVLTCSGLDAGYVPGRPVLRNVDISLEGGKVLALLGPNGAGKTTLLLTIAGLQPPLGGHIGLGGAPVRPGSPRAAVKAGLVLVPDDRSLFKGLTVAENLKLASRRGGTTIEMIFNYFPDLKRRAKVAAGNLSVNSHSAVRYWTPFGGFGQSGLGRELGPSALAAFTETKNVFISTEE